MIPGLDGLRAIAFLMIFGFHTDHFPFGWLGVQMFFVFSGFLITGILLKMKANLPAKEYFLKFYTRRFFRIFPLYYFYLFLVLGLATWWISISYKTKIANVIVDQIGYAFLYVYNFYATHRDFNSSPFLDHLWSLSVEEQFYIFWPLLIFFVNEKHLKKLFLAGIIAGPVFRFAISLIYQAGIIESFRVSTLPPVYTLPFSHVDAFALGAYITRFPIPNARRQLAILSISAPLIGFITQFAANGEFGEFLTLGYRDSLPDGYQYIWAYTLLNYWFVVLIYCVARERLFVRFLEWQPLRYLGKISYGLYIYHFPIVFYFPVTWFMDQIRVFGVSERFTSPLVLIAWFIITVAVASLSYYFLEKPFLKLKDRYASYAD
ncbi:MAG: acyltransferase [Anaerolineales bacterium]|nr:acyltransferase [Anaerolineales bacterium]